MPARLLVPVVASAARGDCGGCAAAAAAAIAAGATPDEVRAALRLVHPFAGFPRALDAFAAAAVHLGPGGGPSTVCATDPAAAGRAFFDLVYGPDADRILGRIRSLDADAAARVIEDAYGRVLSASPLAEPVRERLAVAMLAAQGLLRQLGGHVRGALRCGATREEIEGDLAAAAHWIEPEAARAAGDELARAV